MQLSIDNFGQILVPLKVDISDGPGIVHVACEATRAGDILQALALALMPEWQVSAIAASVRLPVDVKSTIRLVRYGDVVTRVLRKDRGHIGVGPTGTNLTAIPWLLAYGTPRPPAKAGQFYGFSNVLSLFDPYELTMINHNPWLVTVGLAERIHGEVEFAKSVYAAILALTPEFDSVAFAEHRWYLSTGKSFVAIDRLDSSRLYGMFLLIDILARVSHRARQLERPLSGDTSREVSGLVLIDGIDRWFPGTLLPLALDVFQRTFPRMTFVVTHHGRTD